MTLARTPVRSLVRRASRTSRLVAIAALLAAPLAAALATTPAGAVTAASVDLMTVGGASLKADGHTWLVTLHYTGSPVASISQVGFAVAREEAEGQEFHSWAAEAVGASFTFNSTTGRATLNSGRSLSPVASFDVTFTPSKRSSTACSFGAKETVYTGTLKGSVHIVTGTKPVSITLASRAASFTKGGATTLTVDPCLSAPPCTGDGWSAPEIRTGLPFGTVGASGSGVYAGKSLRYTVAVTRETELSKVPSLIRDDGALAYVSAPKWDPATKALTVSASGIVTGSGVLTGGTGVSSVSEVCLIAGKKHAERYTAYIADAKLSKWKAFVGHTVLSGNLTASSRGMGGFDIYTVT
jgi:hypothetical protein